MLWLARHQTSSGMQLQLLCTLSLIIHASAVGPLVHTTTGPIVGSEVAPGVLGWKGVPFAVPPIGRRRWTAPVLNRWTRTKNTTALGPACIQQLDKSQATTDASQLFYNNPPLAEDENCLTINVWAPSESSGKPKTVLFWIFGNGFAFGGSGTFFYDGTSFAAHQDVIIVSHNYRTNVFGFPNSPGLPLRHQNLGLLDQQLALSWTRDNIARFGGDPHKITLFGLSAGSASAALLLEHFPSNPPFHAVILQSGVIDALDNARSSASSGNFSVWNGIATHFGCSSGNGSSQLDCMRKIPANDLEQFIVNNALNFGPQADGGVTVPAHPSELLKAGNVAQVPIMIGDNAEGGSFLTVGQDNFTDFISQSPWNNLPADELRKLYPVPEKFVTDAQAIVALATDLQFRCPSSLFADLFTIESTSTVYRYVYGAVFPEFQLFPNAGSPEGTELPLVFGNLFNPANLTEVALSKTLQTVWANFAKEPNQSPAPSWPAYRHTYKAIANLAFANNVALDNVVQVANTSDVDRACTLLDTLLR